MRFANVAAFTLTISRILFWRVASRIVPPRWTKSSPSPTTRTLRSFRLERICSRRAASDRLIKVWDVASLGQGIEPKGLILQGDTDTLEALWKERLGLLGEQVVVEMFDQTKEGRLLDIAWEGVLVEEAGQTVSIPPEMVRHITGNCGLRI